MTRETKFSRNLFKVVDKSKNVLIELEYKEQSKVIQQLEQFTVSQFHKP